MRENDGNMMDVSAETINSTCFDDISQIGFPHNLDSISFTSNPMVIKGKRKSLVEEAQDKQPSRTHQDHFSSINMSGEAFNSLTLETKDTMGIVSVCSTEGTISTSEYSPDNGSHSDIMEASHPTLLRERFKSMNWHASEKSVSESRSNLDSFQSYLTPKIEFVNSIKNNAIQKKEVRGLKVESENCASDNLTSTHMNRLYYQDLERKIMKGVDRNKRQGSQKKKIHLDRRPQLFDQSSISTNRQRHKLEEKMTLSKERKKIQISEKEQPYKNSSKNHDQVSVLSKRILRDGKTSKHATSKVENNSKIKGSLLQPKKSSYKIFIRRKESDKRIFESQTKKSEKNLRPTSKMESSRVQHPLRSIAVQPSTCKQRPMKKGKNQMQREPNKQIDTPKGVFTNPSRLMQNDREKIKWRRCATDNEEINHKVQGSQQPRKSSYQKKSNNIYERLYSLSIGQQRDGKKRREKIHNGTRSGNLRTNKVTPQNRMLRIKSVPNIITYGMDERSV